MNGERELENIHGRLGTSVNSKDQNERRTAGKEREVMNERSFECQGKRVMVQRQSGGEELGGREGETPGRYGNTRGGQIKTGQANMDPGR